MSMIYVLRTFEGERSFEDLESLVSNLLHPDAPTAKGQLEQLQEEVDHMRDCLARFIAREDPTSDSLSAIFYADVSITEGND